MESGPTIRTKRRLFQCLYLWSWSRRIECHGSVIPCDKWCAWLDEVIQGMKSSEKNQIHAESDERT